MSFEQEVAEVLVNLRRRVERLEIQESSGSGAIQLIAETELTADTAIVSLTSIPDSYRGLIVTGQFRTTRSNDNDTIDFRFNGSSATNYDYFSTAFRGDSATVYNSGSGVTEISTVFNCEGGTACDSNFTPALGYILGYAETNRQKQIFSVFSGRFGDTTSNTDFLYRQTMGRWRSSDAITQIDMFSTNGCNIAASSIVQLYGIL